MKTKKQLAEEIIKNKTAKQMQDFLQGSTIEQQGLTEAFFDFLGEKHVIYFLDWNIVQEDERKQAAEYLSKFMGEFIKWTRSR